VRQNLRYALPMSDALTARDLWPLVLKLSHGEQVALAKLALKASIADDAAAYRAAPEGPDEFGADDDSLAWEGTGWESFSAKG